MATPKKHKSYLPEAQRHFAEIQRLHTYANQYSHSQAEPFYFKLEECYSKSGRNRASDLSNVYQLFMDAKPLMEELKKLEDAATKASETPKE